MEKMASRAGRLKERGAEERGTRRLKARGEEERGTRRLKARGRKKDTLSLNLAS